MSLVNRLLKLLGFKPMPSLPMQQREPHMSCMNCCHFADHYDPSDDPDEVDGYCCYDYTTGVTSNEYGGHWTHSKAWCSMWKQDDGSNGWYPKRDDPAYEDSDGPLREVDKDINE